MSALSAERSTVQLGSEALPDRLAFPIAANVKIYKGGLVVLNSSGYAAPGSAAAGLIALGRAFATYDNTGGSNGAMTVQVGVGTYKWFNSSSSDQITQQNAGQDCYVVDDQTVALTDGNGARSRAGKIILVDTDGGVFVAMGPFSRDLVNMTETITIPISAYSAMANAGFVVNNLKLGYAGRIRKATLVTTTPVTTAAKAATIQLAVNPGGGAAVNCTGGAISATSANQNAIGNCLDSTAVTAGGTFGVADGISAVISGVTAFVEGAGALVIELG